MGIIKFIILGVSMVVNAVVTLNLLVCLSSGPNEFDRAVDEFTELIKKLWDAGNFFGKFITVFVSIILLILVLPCIAIFLLCYFCIVFFRFLCVIGIMIVHLFFPRLEIKTSKKISLRALFSVRDLLNDK